jgi:ubiquitin-protein ligase
MERQVARARSRLLRDWRVLQEEPLCGVAAEPLEDNIFIWHANLDLEDQGAAALHFEIYVPHTYPLNAPMVFFPKGLPHPNCFPQRSGRALVLCHLS